MTEPIDQLNKYTLQIHDPLIEKAFKNYRYQEVYLLSKVVFGAFMLLQIVILSMREYSPKYTSIQMLSTGIPLLILNILGIILVCMAGRKPQTTAFFGPILWSITLLLATSCYIDEDTNSEDTCEALLLDAKYDLLVTLIFFQTNWFFDWLFYTSTTYVVLGATGHLKSFLFFRALPLSLYVSYILERGWKVQFLENSCHQKSTQFYQKMLDLTKDGVIITDKLSEKTLFFNKLAQKLIGLKRQLHYQSKLSEAYDYDSNEWLQEQLFNKEVFVNEAQTNDSNQISEEQDLNNSNQNIIQSNDSQKTCPAKGQSLSQVLSAKKGVNYTVKREIQKRPEQRNIQGNSDNDQSDRNINERQNEVAIQLDDIEVVESDTSKNSTNNKNAQQNTLDVSNCAVDYIVQVEEQNLQDRYQVIYLRNVTQIMENQVIKQLSRTQELLQATVSHELRAPLSNITLVSKLLIRSLGDCRNPADQERLRYYKQIEDQSTFLLFLVNDLLDISQIKNGILNLNPVDFRVNKFLRQTLDMFDLQAQQCKTLISFKLHPSVPNYIYGEKTRLQQVIINLVKNALKFTREGKINIEMEYDYTASLLIVHVRDTGKGIKQEDQSKLFKMFGKLQRTAEINHEGVGLGLTISKMLVEKLGGEISVQSDGIDKGSCFSFSMKFQCSKTDGRPQELISGKNIGRNYSNKSLNFIQTDLNEHSMNINLNNDDIEQSFIGNQMRKKKRQDQIQEYEMIQLKQMNQDVNRIKTKSDQGIMSPDIESYDAAINQLQDSKMTESISDNSDELPIKLVTPQTIKQNQQQQEFKDILAIDDSIFNLEAFQMILNACWQLDCSFQTDGREAIKHIEHSINSNHLYKLVLIDYSMPDLDGPSTAKEIIKLYEKYQKPLPVLVCFSAYQQDTFKNIALEAGMHHYLVKPPQQKDLKIILQKSNLI